MVVKKVIFVGFMSSLVLSLVAMEPSSESIEAASGKVCIQYYMPVEYLHLMHSFPTATCLPKDVTNLILNFNLELIKNDKSVKQEIYKFNHVFLSLNKQERIERDNGSTIELQDVLARLKTKEQLNIFIAAPQILSLNPFSQDEYKNTMTQLPLFLRIKIGTERKVKVYKMDESKQKSLVTQKTIIGGMTGISLYTIAKKTLGDGYIVFSELSQSAGIGAGCACVVYLLQDWLNKKAVPTKKKIIDCFLFSQIESEKIRQCQETVNKTTNIFCQRLDKKLNNQQKDTISTHFRIQNHE